MVESGVMPEASAKRGMLLALRVAEILELPEVFEGQFVILCGNVAGGVCTRRPRVCVPHEGPRCGVLGCPRERPRWAGLCVHTRGPRDGGLLRCGEFVDSPECCFEGKCSQRAFPCRRVEAGELAKRSNDAGLGPSGARGAPACGTWCKQGVLAAARSNRSHTPRRKALRCVSERELKEQLCGEGVSVTERKSAVQAGLIPFLRVR